MARFWCISAPLYSHTDWGGFLRTAHALHHLGHDIVWVSEAPLQQVVTAQGIPFHPIPHSGWLWPPPPTPDLSQLKPHDAVSLRYRRALDTWLSEELVSQGTQALLDLATRIGTPDAFLIDPFLSSAALAADVLNIPLFVCGWQAQANLDEQALFPVQRNLSSDSQQRIARLCQQFGIQGRYFSKGAAPSIISPHLHISYFTRDWYAHEADFLLPQNHFVGGTPQRPTDPPPTWLTDIPDGTPLALITLGTVFTGDLGFFSWSAQAAARHGLLPIVVIGWNPITPEDKTQLKRALPAGTRLLNFVPFDHVLPRTTLMIHHGGMGTTHYAVVHGLRQIVVPHAADQRIQAERVARAKVGLNLSAHDVRQGKLGEAVKALLEAAWVESQARDLAARMAALGGAPQAARVIEHTLSLL